MPSNLRVTGEMFVQDVRLGWRLLRRTPGFTIAAVLALGLGTGVTTAVFNERDQVVLRPLSYADPERLAMIWEANTPRALAHEPLSPVNFGDYRALTHVFDDAAAWWYPQINLTAVGHEPLRVRAVEASANLFRVLGVHPAMGAGFPVDALFARDPIAVISHRLWRDRFGSDPSVVGSSIVLSGVAHVVIGVMPAGFAFTSDTDVWQRLTWDMAQHSRGALFMESVARLSGRDMWSAGDRVRPPATNRSRSIRLSTSSTSRRSVFRF